ncbi:MAG: hypothetical protein ACOC16_02865 [Nanoarchaeota archaeon]
MIFEKIINFDSNFQYKQISKTKKATDIYLVEDKKVNQNTKKYILKINHQKNKEEYNLIINTIKLLNKNKYPTPKLLHSKYINSKSYFIFEYIKGNPIKQESKNIIPISNLIKEFYNITKNTPINSNLTLQEKVKNFKLNISTPIYKKIFYDILTQIIQNIQNEKLRIIDINTSNFINIENQLYIIDFDEIFFTEIEFDIADLFTDFVKIHKDSFFEIIKYYNLFLNEFKEYDINNEKIINYMILILISELTNNAPKEENTWKMQAIHFLFTNKNTFLKYLK